MRLLLFLNVGYLHVRQPISPPSRTGLVHPIVHSVGVCECNYSSFAPLGVRRRDPAHRSDSWLCWRMIPARTRERARTSEGMNIIYFSNVKILEESPFFSFLFLLFCVLLDCIPRILNMYFFPPVLSLKFSSKNFEIPPGILRGKTVLNSRKGQNEVTIMGVSVYTHCQQNHLTLFHHRIQISTLNLSK